MEQYQGYKARQPEPRPDRELPQVTIYGTRFLIDIAHHQFRQADQPANRMTMGDIPEEMGFTHILYDMQTRNRYAGPVEKDSRFRSRSVSYWCLP
ncbi:hypothetical protein ACFJIV_29120 [Mucilaginibacter sp. UC70_90]